MKKHDTIVLLTRYPEVGKVKTRLIPSYGPKGACDLHDAMTRFTISQCQEVDCNIEVHHFGGSKQDMHSWLNKPHQNKKSNMQFIPQVQGHLGDKIFAALKYALNNLYDGENLDCKRKKVIIIGSDCPDNRSDNLCYALDLLENNDVVIGPSLDGGYYLIGFGTNLSNVRKVNDFLSAKINFLFQGIVWGTEFVFATTIQKLKENNFKFALLPAKSDVDFDFQVSKKISVIIPTLNEEDNLNHLLSNFAPAFNVEVIVCDGHSADNTMKIAAKHNVIALSTEANRSKQMIHAVSKSSGEYILFLHADSILPPQWDIHIRSVLLQEKNSLGYFHFGIKENFWTKAIIEWGTNFRCKYFKLPFGDQGLFVRKKDFEQWNLSAVPILEDVKLVQCAQKHGQIVGLSYTLLTSGRRWFKHGFIRTTIMNHSVLLCAKLGMDLEKIKQAYVKGQNPFWNYIRK